MATRTRQDTAPRRGRAQRAGGAVAARRDRRVHPARPHAGAADRGRQARPADLRARRHHEPPADLGYRLPAAGRDVPRGGRDRRARRAARLFPRAERVPRLALGLGRRRARRPDGAHRLPRRPHADPQGAEPCARRMRARPRCRRWSMSATPWKRRSTIWRRRPASLGCSACRPSCSRRATIRSPNRRSARSRGSRAAPIAASISRRAHELAELLRAAAVYAAGGVKALADLSARRSAGAQKLLAQMR